MHFTRSLAFLAAILASSSLTLALSTPEIDVLMTERNYFAAAEASKLKAARAVPFGQAPDAERLEKRATQVPAAHRRRRGIVPESVDFELLEKREINLEALQLLKREATALSSGLAGPVYGAENGLNGVVTNGEGILQNLVNTVDPLRQLVDGVSYTSNGVVVSGEYAVNNLLGGIGVLRKRLAESDKRDLSGEQLKHVKRQADKLAFAVYGVENGLNGVVTNAEGIVRNLANNLQLATVFKRAQDLGNTLNGIVFGTEYHANGAVVSADQAVLPVVAVAGSSPLNEATFGALAGANTAVVGTENAVNSVLVNLVTSNLHARGFHDDLKKRAEELTSLVDGLSTTVNGATVGTEVTLNQVLANLGIVAKRAQDLATTVNGIVLGTEYHGNGAIVSADQAVLPVVAAAGSPELNKATFDLLAGVNSVIVGTEADVVNPLVAGLTGSVPKQA